MKKDNALLVAGIIFSLVAIAHLLRLILGTAIIISDYAIPQRISAIGFVVAAILALWMFRARKAK